MIFLITRKDDIHADIVAEKLNKQGSSFFRFNTEQSYDYKITLSYSGGRIVNNVSGKKLDLEKIKSVWLRRRSFPDNKNISEDFKNFTDQEWRQFYRNIWLCMGTAFWLSTPFAIEEAGDKLRQLRLAKEIGFLIPETIFSNSLCDVANFQKKHGECIFKPFDVGGFDYRNKAVYASLLDRKMFDISGIEEGLRACPGIFQSYVEKKYELRITVVGKKVFATRIESQKSDRTKIDWRRYDFRNVPHYAEVLPEEVEKMCGHLVERLGLQFGAIDMIVSPSEKYYFLEINANGQWAWIEALTKQSISSEIVSLLIHQSNV